MDNNLISSRVGGRPTHSTGMEGGTTVMHRVKVDN